MFESKSILASRTVWANLIGLTAILVGLFGYDTATLDANAVADAIVQIVVSASFIASTVFRIAATKLLLS
jgi:hypothetical protein